MKGLLCEIIFEEYISTVGEKSCFEEKKKGWGKDLELREITVWGVVNMELFSSNVTKPKKVDVFIWLFLLKTSFCRTKNLFSQTMDFG